MRSTLAKVRLEMTKLPAEQRAALMLVCVEGMSYQEAAVNPMAAELAQANRENARLKQPALLNLKPCCADVRAFEIRIFASSIEKQLVLDAFMQI